MRKMDWIFFSSLSYWISRAKVCYIITRRRRKKKR